jgi:hypothetical protein
MGTNPALRQAVAARFRTDPRAGVVEPKSAAGRRTVPIPDVLRRHLAAHMLRVGRREGFVFGRSEGSPFSYSSMADRLASPLEMVCS